MENNVIQSIVVGISQALSQEFGDGYVIYDSDVEQGLQKPCFFVQLLTSSQSCSLGERIERSQAFSITYFPSGDQKTELYHVSECLDRTLEYIRVEGDLVRGKNISHTITDGVLISTIDYDFRIKSKTFINEYMEQIEIRKELS